MTLREFDKFPAQVAVLVRGGVLSVTENALAFFIQDLREGGAERSVARLLNGIVARGIAVDLVVIQRKGTFFDELDARVNVIELPQRRTVSSVRGLRRYIQERRPSAMVSSMTHTNVAAILANAIARPRTRLVVVEHNQYSLNRARKKGLVALSYGMVRWLYPRADRIAAVSEGVRSDLARAAGISVDRIGVLHNPVVTDDIERLADDDLDHPWFCDGAPPVVLAVGRLTRQKNLALLVDAFAEVRRRRDARLLILGEGELRGEIEAKVRALGLEADVDLPGFDPNPFRYMRQAGVYVLSSDWEGLPTALIEAMACGAPVVATDCHSGPREILLGGRLSRIVPVGDADALAGAIVATLADPGDRNLRVARAREFSVARAVDGYLEAAGWRQ